MAQTYRGTCFALFAYDVGLSVNLGEAQKRVAGASQRENFKHRRRAPKYFQYQPPPVRFAQDMDALGVGACQTNPVVDITLYDFGAVSVVYSVSFDGPLERLVSLSGELYENALLLADSRSRAVRLLETLEPAVRHPQVSDFVEDYVVFQFAGTEPPATVRQMLDQSAPELAQILRAETSRLSQDEISDALSQRISFGVDDMTIIDWNAAIVVDRDAEDALAVLEFANVELNEMRHLDGRLDDALGLAYETLSERKLTRFVFGADPPELRRVAQWQVDAAILFEGVNNALKLVGDQYLARLYRRASARFHLAEWDATILRKLETLDSIYGKISDRVSHRRMEVLEWIIIILIAVSILLPFFGILAPH